MATVNKDFKIKNGLVVEGTTGTINGEDILTKAQADQTYITNLVGGTGTAENTPDTLVKRDGSGNFAAGTVTASRVNIGSVGYIEDDGSIEIVNTDGDDINIIADDIRLRATDDVLITSGDQGSTTGDIALTTSGGNIRFQAADVYLGTNIGFTDAERVATQGYVDNAITNIDLTFNTDEITEGSTNLYYTDARVDSHLSGGDGISYSAGTISADVANGIEITDGHIVIDRDAVDTWYDAAGAAATAQSNAEDYADGLAVNYDAAGSASAAQTAAENYADGLAVNYDPAGSASTAETNANNYTDTALGNYTTTANLDTTIDGYGYLKSADLSGYATESYVGTAIDNLVDGAPGLLDTLNEIAAAINDDANYATTITTALSGKQGNLTASTGITIDGSNNISVTANTYDAYGAAATAQSNAEDYADGLAVNYDAAGAAATAQSNAETFATNAIDALDTDDIEEGFSNLYFTDGRAESAAINLLTNATKNNIEISYVANVGLTITAENGVADSDTDDLTEGTTNLYFTDERAVDAITNATIYPTVVDINDYRREEATQQVVASASTVTAHTFTGNRSVKYLVRTVGTVSGTLHSQITELLVTVDGGNNIAVTEYGTIHTSENALSTATMDYSGGEYRLRVTTAITGAEVVAAATIMSWAD